MKRSHKLNMIFAIIVLWIGKISFSQRSIYIPDLSAINDTTRWGNFDRDVRFDSVVVFNAKANEGPVWLKDYSLFNGRIEVDVKGKNLQGQSFVGIAFHIIDGKTFEAIYFRPFNFLNAERSAHSVQ